MLVVLISVNHTSCRLKRTISTKWKPFCAQRHRTQFPLLICIEVIHFLMDGVHQWSFYDVSDQMYREYFTLASFYSFNGLGALFLPTQVSSNSSPYWIWYGKMAARLVCSVDSKSAIFYSLVTTYIPEIEAAKVNRLLTTEVSFWLVSFSCVYGALRKLCTRYICRNWGSHSSGI